MVVNGWDVARDNNRSKSLGGQLALTPAAPLAIYLDGMWGPEQPGNDRNDRALLDVAATLKARWLTLGFNADRGTERFDTDQVGITSAATWSGAAGYLRATITPSFALIARGESFDDRDGVRTGVAQTISEFTLTPELRLTPHLLARADGRVDHSNRAVFEKANGLVRSQPTILFGLIYSF